MIDKVFSFAMLVPLLAFALGAWLIWRRPIQSQPFQGSTWRRAAIIIGLLSLSADAVLSAGYLLYLHSSPAVRWSVFNTCSNIGAVACLIGLLAAAAGTGAARLPLLFGCLYGMVFWYLTISPRL